MAETESAQRGRGSSDNRDSGGDSNGSGGFVEDPQIQEVLAEDPLFRFLTDRWRGILTVAGVALAVLYGKQVFEETHVSSMRSAADIFLSVRTEYDGLVSARAAFEKARLDLTAEQDETKRAELEKAVTSGREQLSEGATKIGQLLDSLAETKSPYRDYAVVYRAACRADRGKAGRGAPTPCRFQLGGGRRTSRR